MLRVIGESLNATTKIITYVCLVLIKLYKTKSIAPQDRHRGHCHMWCLPYGNGPIGITNDVIPKTDKSIDDAN